MQDVARPPRPCGKGGGAEAEIAKRRAEDELLDETSRIFPRFLLYFSRSLRAVTLEADGGAASRRASEVAA